jgi:hypothetical protein
VISDDKKLDEIQKFLLQIYSVFEKRPGLLGHPNDLPPILWVADSISDILNNQTTNENGTSWQHFLYEKKLLAGDDNKLTKILAKDNYEFSYLQELRREYCEWREKALRKLGSG